MRCDASLKGLGADASRKDRYNLGTRTADIGDLDKRRESEKQSVIDGGEKLREEMEEEGEVDRYEKMQPPRPKVDETLIGARIEQLWEYKEKDGTAVKQWCQGIVIAVKKNSRVLILQWEKDCLRKGDPAITQEKFLKS